MAQTRTSGRQRSSHAHPPKGISPRLTIEQKAEIPALLAKGAKPMAFEAMSGRQAAWQK